MAADCAAIRLSRDLNCFAIDISIAKTADESRLVPSYVGKQFSSQITCTVAGVSPLGVRLVAIDAQMASEEKSRQSLSLALVIIGTRLVRDRHFDCESESREGLGGPYLLLWCR
jgi:hypothetical protein